MIEIREPEETGVTLVNYEERKRGRPQLSPEEMKDARSAGRKRAAKELEIEPGTKCEWTELRFAGGGVIPIIGCFGDDARHAHHGPDKNTLNNTEGVNLHRVCHRCHNRWHTLNDEFYGERPPATEPFVPVGHNLLPHDPVTKTSIELRTRHEIWWQTKKKLRVDYKELKEKDDVV